MEYNSRSAKAGFTFIEVLIAILIFTMVVVASLGVMKGSVKATQESRDISTATWLLRDKIVDIETNIETQGVDKGCDKKKEGKFPAPNERFRWRTSCDQIDIKLPETSSANKDDNGDSDNETHVNEMEKMIMDTASDYLGKSIRELHAEVLWNQGKTERHVSVTTEWARYDQPLNLPGLGTTGQTPQGQNPGGSSGGASTGGGHS